MSVVNGCRVIQNKKNFDDRGFFTTIYSHCDIFTGGKLFECRQTNIGHNKKAGTARGLHLQGIPHGQVKIVTCISGSADVFILDSRIGSPTYKNVFSSRLSSDEDVTTAIYVPRYCSFGYVTLSDNCSMLYYMDAPFFPQSQLGYNIMDKSLGIKQDLRGVLMSDRDRALPNFSDVGGV